MKIGTISVNINAPDFNYGAILHTWAFLRFVQALPLVESAELIDYTMPSLQGQRLRFPAWTALKGGHPRRALRRLACFLPYQRRYQKFQRFIAGNMPRTPQRYTQATLDQARLDYDCVICESDVIWNHLFTGEQLDRSFFLAADSMKAMRRVAYAPSLGDGNLSPRQKEDLRAFLRFPHFISCREMYGKALIQTLTDKPVAQVVDPVLLLDAKDYSAICAAPLMDEPYALIYAPVNENTKMHAAAQLYAKQHGLRLLEIRMDSSVRRLPGGRCLTDAGVEEFLSALRHADAVFTNSFHAVCFSLLFHVNFFAFSRRHPRKVQDICELFDLGNHYFPDDDFRDPGPIDFVAADQRLAALRAESVAWLINSLTAPIDIL